MEHFLQLLDQLVILSKAKRFRNSTCVNSTEQRKYQRAKVSGYYKFIQYQVLQTNNVKVVWQKVRRFTNEIFGVKALKLYL